MYPKNEAEFIRFMEDIDDELKRRGVPLSGRPLGAIGEACVKLKTPLNVAPLGPLVPGVYSGDSLSRHIEGWYTKKYGDRLKINWSPGSAAIIIRGDPWKIKLPFVIGLVEFAFDPCLDKYQDSTSSPDSVNPLRCIEGLTSDFAKGLARQEMKEIAGFFVFALRSTQRLREANGPYLAEARVDLETAVSDLFLARPNYGQSKWASLQFTEKLLKSYLTLEGVPFPKNHDLASLSMLAASRELQVIGPNIITAIQCPAGVRYGETKVSLSEAIKAHHASLEVCHIVCSTIKALRPFGSVGADDTIEPTPGLTEGLFYVLPGLNYYYYCDKIVGGLVHWVLVESYQKGSLIQAALVQDIKHASKYVQVTRVRKIRSLEEMLKKLRQPRPVVRAPRK